MVYHLYHLVDNKTTDQVITAICIGSINNYLMLRSFKAFF
nr:MAG TPA: hypothetical protein [Caudoviricetes sp.]